MIPSVMRRTIGTSTLLVLLGCTEGPERAPAEGSVPRANPDVQAAAPSVSPADTMRVDPDAVKTEPEDVPDPPGPIALLLPTLDTLDNYEFRIQRTDSMEAVNLRRTTYGYHHKTEAWPYGSGFLIWREEAGSIQPLWLYREAGDFGPHSWNWVDFDVDGRKDLLMFGGEEGVHRSQVFLNRLGDTFSLSNFVRVYDSESPYVVVVDPESDGIPEVLDPGPYLDDPMALSYYGCEPPDSLAGEVMQEYERMSGGFRSAHFGSGTGSRALSRNIYLLHKVRLFRFEGGAFREVTREYPDHLEWRLSVLETHEAQEERCRTVLAEVRNYLEGQLDSVGTEVSAGPARGRSIG